MERNGDQVHWDPIFRRYLTKHEVSHLMSLLDLPNWLSIQGVDEDSRVWVPSKDEYFSVASFQSLVSVSRTAGSLLYIWELKVPPRVIAFGWLALRGATLTMDDLYCRKVVIVDPC